MKRAAAMQWAAMMLGVVIGLTAGDIVVACSPAAQQLEVKTLRTLILASGALCIAEAGNDALARTLCEAAERELIDVTDGLVVRRDASVE